MPNIQHIRNKVKYENDKPRCFISVQVFFHLSLYKIQHIPSCFPAKP